MKKVNETLQKFFMATAFAEVGEFDMAKEIIDERKSDQDREIQETRKMPRILSPKG